MHICVPYKKEGQTQIACPSFIFNHELHESTQIKPKTKYFGTTDEHG